MYKFFQIFKRDLLNLFFNPMWIFFSLLYPFLLIGILGFLNRGNFGGDFSSYDYYGISMLIYAVLNGAMTSANSFMEERIKQGNMRIIFSPLPKAFIYSSKIMASLSFSFFWHLVLVLLLKTSLGVNFGGNSLGHVILLLFFLEVFASILGVLFCCIFKSESIANQILSIVITVFALLGGLFFRLDGFGEIFARISSLSPLRWIVVDIFKIIYDGDFSTYSATILILVFLSVIGLVLCGKFYRVEDYV